MQVPTALGINYVCSHASDADKLVRWNRSYCYDAEWEAQLNIIYPILKANYLSLRQPSLSYKQLYSLCKEEAQYTYYEWMRPRRLALGEVSVLLKHYWALTTIANCDDEYGLIIEDDARLHNHSKQSFWNCFNQFFRSNGDYLDLAGGCNLHPADVDRNEGCVSRLGIPRTRTNAAYLVSRNLAKSLSEAFLPMALPIDWHLQSLFSNSFTYFWANNSPLLHGSEHGLVRSWR
jgi:GR25 family glycosyltransferase involved in LPS biosynthesis